MTGLYSPINKLMEQVTRPKGTGAEYMTELQKKPGYKPAEAEDRDLQALMALPQMQRAEFMEKLKGQANKFPLKMRELGEGQTHHERYTLPGGENYREILLHTPMPEGEGFPGVEHHFGGTPNILASVRVKDRISPEGKKVLHLEEIQSDWHQQGREQGYGDANLQKQIAEIKDQRRQLDADYWKQAAELKNDPQAYLRLAPTKQKMAALTKQLERLEEDKEHVVPYGPHAKDWHELALKAMIQHAAENGYDQIAVTPGAEQAKRFGLSKHLSEVQYNHAFKRLAGFDKSGTPVVYHADVEPEQLSNYVGKEIATKLLAQPQNNQEHSLKGLDLETGGEGMKGFYDKMVPTFLNKFGKKHGVQVGQGSIDTGQHKVVNDGHADAPYRVSNSEGFVSRHATPDEAQTRAAQLNQAPVHTFDITPAMRDDVVKNGIPRYNEGGDVSRETTEANKAKFLKGSKVSQRLYHGTMAHDDYADEERQAFQQFTGSPTWLAEEPYTANAYAGARGTVYPVHAQIKKPLVLGFNADDDAKRAFPTAKRLGVDVEHIQRMHRPEQAWEVVNHPSFIDAAQKAGYDSIQMHEGDYKTHGVFDPRKIKSAIGNRGTYDTNETDINKAEGGVVKEKVTISPNMDVMQYELLTKKVK